MYNGLPMTSAVDSAFYKNNIIITSVIIPNGATNASEKALFGCDKLKELEIR
jgi:hypothetical protein